MVDNIKVSGLVVLSKPEWGCYPYLEAIQSFLPVVDELVIAYDIYDKKDGSREKIEALNNPKIRIVPTMFDIERFGWISYGVARTIGYQACKGDIVLMFDGDGLLHESEQSNIERDIRLFVHDGYSTGYWNKNRIYKPELYYSQFKHSGIYYKKRLGDRLHFFQANYKGAPNFCMLTDREGKSRAFSVTLFGYEHVWDTEEVLKIKIARYGRMIAKVHNQPIKTDEEYFDTYMRALVEKISKVGKVMEIKRHPAIIQKKLRSINETHFGYNFFGYK